MIIGFSKYGRGKGDRPLNYLTEGMATAVGYLTGTTRKGLERNPPPVVIRGNPELTRQVINRVPFTRKYTSGVISFSEQKISPEMETEIMNRFETVAFAGLSKDRYQILWVRHSHTGRHEMHFASPAIDLATGKNLNINPPRETTRQLFDTFRRLTNDEFQLTDPDDPARARTIRTPSYLLKGSPTRDDVHSTIGSYLDAKAGAGVIRNREDVLHSLREAGYVISRVGDKYVTVTDTAGKHCRLKGTFFERDFSPVTQPASEPRLSPEERAGLEGKLNRLVADRAAFNRQRYGKMIEPERIDLTSSPQLEPSYDRIGTPFDGRLGTFGQCLPGAREEFAGAIARLNRSTGLWRSACERTVRTSDLARESNQRLIAATQGFREALPKAIAVLEAREINQRILHKYGVCLDARGKADREMNFEMEMAE